jgi:hypothetical protein
MSTYYFSEDGKIVYGESYKNLAAVSVNLTTPEEREGYVSRPAYNPETGEGYWKYIEIRKTPEQELQELKKLQDSLKSASEKYADLNQETATLEEVQSAKIAQLKEQCTQSIYEGFASNSLGHIFGFNELDQANFTQRMLTIVAGAVGPFKWKTKDAGVVELTADEFKTVVNEAEAHKLNQQERYWELETLVLAATTKSDVDAIIWETLI